MNNGGSRGNGRQTNGSRIRGTGRATNIVAAPPQPVANDRTQLLAIPPNSTTGSVLTFAPVLQSRADEARWHRITERGFVEQGQAIAEVAREQGLRFEEMDLNITETRQIITGLASNVRRLANSVARGTQANAANRARAAAQRQQAQQAANMQRAAEAARLRRARARQTQRAATLNARLSQLSQLMGNVRAGQIQNRAVNAAHRAATTPFWRLSTRDMPRAVYIRIREAWWKSLIAGTVVYGIGAPAAAASLLIYWPAYIAFKRWGAKLMGVYSTACLVVVLFGTVFYIRTTESLTTIHKFYDTCENSPAACQLALRASLPLQVAAATAFNGFHIATAGSARRPYYGLPPTRPRVPPPPPLVIYYTPFPRQNPNITPLPNWAVVPMHGTNVPQPGSVIGENQQIAEQRRLWNIQTRALQEARPGVIIRNNNGNIQNNNNNRNIQNNNNNGNNQNNAGRITRLFNSAGRAFKSRIKGINWLRTAASLWRMKRN